MSSVYPAPTHGSQPPLGAHPGYGNQPPPTFDTQPPPGGNGGYFAVPSQGYYPPPGYQAPPGSLPPQGYGAPPQQYTASPAYGASPPQQYAPPQGSGAPPPQYAGYDAQPAQYTPLPGAAWVDPATGTAAPYYSPPYGNGSATTIPFAQPVKYDHDQQQQQQQDPANRIVTGHWSAALCDCCSNCMPNLCMSWCCPCVALAQVYARNALGRYHVVLARLFTLVVGGLLVRFLIPQNTTPEYSGTWDANGNYVYEAPAPDVLSYAGSAAYLLIQVAFALHVYHARTRVRERFQIPGNCCCDCGIACCCSCCAIAQMATHTKSYTPGNCSFGAPNVLPPFQ